MFLGEYLLKFTGHGRIVLPKKIRSELGGEKLILSRGFEGCIWGYSEPGFEKEARKQLEVSATEKRARMLRRYLFSGSEPAELDAQGRFIISDTLMKFAKLQNEVVLIGTGDHFEVWDSVTWKIQLAKIEEEYGRVS